MLKRTPVIIAVAVLIVAAGALIGIPVGHSRADSDAKADERAADRASRQEDTARDRRDLLDARIEVMDKQVAKLPAVDTKGPLLASEKSTDTHALEDEFSVDGGTYTVHGLEVVDSFTSTDPKRPAKEQKGFRYALVDVDYTNRTKEEQSIACGTLGTVRIVLSDGSTIEEIQHEPPVAKGTQVACGEFIPAGKSSHWDVPIVVPEHITIAGIHVQDVYAHSSGSEYNVRSGKAAWIPLDEPLQVGKVGDEDRTIGKVAS